MTRDEFFTVLAESKDKGFDWYYQRTGSCRFIRASKKLNGRETFCPLTVVAYIVTGEVVQTVGWERAIRLLQLDYADGVQIMHAADRYDTVVSGARTLRERVIKTTDVENSNKNIERYVDLARVIVEEAREDLGYGLMDSSGVDLLLDNIADLEMGQAIELWEKVK